MIKPAPAQKIEDIEKKNDGYFVLVAVTKRNRFNEVTYGRLLARGKRRDPVLGQLQKYRGPFYFAYAGKPKQTEYCYYHRVID